MTRFHAGGPAARRFAYPLAPMALVLLASGSAAASSPPDESATTGAPDTGANPAGCVDDWQGEALFADQFKVQWAENYTLTYHENYKVLTVGEPAPGLPAEHYVLLQCGTEAPALEGDLAGAQVVDIPVTSLYSASTSHLGFIDALGIAGTVTGVGSSDFVVMPSVRERIDAGDVEVFAPTYETDAEVVIAGGPDVLVTGGTEDAAYEGIVEAGVPVLANAEWLETSPKGWAEWVGFFAALTNTEARASELYEGWVDEYDDAAALAATATEQPSVITGGLYEGTWYARGGAGIVPRFIADAGGAYVYADDPETGSLLLDIETVLADAADAAVWLSPNAGFTSRSEAIELDERYGEFAAWEEGGVWDNSAAVDPALNIVEVGPTMIGDYLLDYVKILHPELAEDHEFVFFQPIPAE